MEVVDYVEFKEGLPFYDMVCSFMVSLAACPSIFNPGNPMGLSKDKYVSVQGILVQGRHFIPYDTYEQAQKGNISQTKFLKSCCCLLANTAYESVKEDDDKSPEFEFFRHIRNASSHQNVFHFFNSEPSRSASWRSANIDLNSKGNMNPLHGKECFGSFIGIADLIDLLKDIEKKII